MDPHPEARTVVPHQPSWTSWLIAAGLLSPFIAFGLVFAACQYAISHIDNAGISATLACMGFAGAYPANGPAPTFSDGYEPPALADSAQEAHIAAQEKAKYQPLAHALDALTAAVRRRDRTQIAVTLRQARQVCAPLLPAAVANAYGLITTSTTAH
jgi:hypothetical protein